MLREKYRNLYICPEFENANITVAYLFSSDLLNGSDPTDVCGIPADVDRIFF